MNFITYLNTFIYSVYLTSEMIPLGYTNSYYNGIQGWQYTSDGSISGIKGRVDVSCFSDFMYQSTVSPTIPDAVNEKLKAENIKFDAGYLTGFTLGSDISLLQNALSGLGNVTMYDKNGNVITSGIVATGQTLSIAMNTGDAGKVYKMVVVIRGDVSGDGVIKSNDYAMIKNDILNIEKLKNAFYKAADVSGDGLVKSDDYALIKYYILDLSTIKQ